MISYSQEQLIAIEIVLKIFYGTQIALQVVLKAARIRRSIS